MYTLSKEQIEQVIKTLEAEFTTHEDINMLQGLLAQPEDDGSDWFYKLQFICRVLGGNPPEQDKATALGMARSLKRERWVTVKALQPITADMVTDEMQEQFLKTPYDAARKDVFVAAVNAWGAKQ
jgi:hypothetical protein